MAIAEEEMIFNAARQIVGHAARQEFLDQACQKDSPLRKRIATLLRIYDETPSLLEPIHNGRRRSHFDPQPGTVIGPFKLIEQIGEGGMGSVYLAEQHDPIRRQVALKIIKSGMDTREVIARFEAERQALALMDHANIARVFEAGATVSGSPFFAMELVRGDPITIYCDRQKLSTPDRLGLFITLCHAVQHAHQKGIIHRDLKPSNVIVTCETGEPKLKVIDFGVAKALHQKLTEQTLNTGLARIIGTPAYMSPEQAELGGIDVDTRSDVYSLGVLLYELLTGSTPFDKKRLASVGFDELRRIIREEEPETPSTRLNHSCDTIVCVAEQRQTEPAKLTRLVQGDLDWIVMKALEKDRSRRYETATGMARDIERFLAHEPVEACPPSAGYRLRKFVRRHWRALSTTAAFVLVLVTAVVTLAVALVAVNRERHEKVAALDEEAKRRKQARSALDVMSSQLIEFWLPRQPQFVTEQKRFVEQVLSSYEEFATDTGQLEESRAGVAQAYQRVGKLRMFLGQSKESEAAFHRCRELYSRLVADFPADPAYQYNLAETQNHLGYVYRDTGRPAEAEIAFLDAQAILKQLARDFPTRSEFRRVLAENYHGLGIWLKNANRLSDAEKAYILAEEIYQQLAADFPAERDFRFSLAQTQMSLGNLLSDLARPLDAVEALDRAVAISKQLVADFPTEVTCRESLARSLNNRAEFLRIAQRYPEAEESFRHAVAIRKQLAADFPAVPDYRAGLAMALNNLGILLKNTGRGLEAEELYGQALAIHRQLAADFPAVPDRRNNAAGAMVNLARLLLARKDLDGARRLLEEAVPHHLAALNANPRHRDYRQYYRNNRWRLAETLLELRDHAGAAVTTGQFLEAATEPPRDSYTAAGLLAGCARLAAEDERLPEVKRQELASSYGDRAVDALRQAVVKGAKEVAGMKTDSALDPLRPRADFQALLAEIDAARRP